MPHLFRRGLRSRRRRFRDGGDVGSLSVVIFFGTKGKGTRQSVVPRWSRIAREWPRAGRACGDDEGRTLHRIKKKPHAVLQHEADISDGVTNGIFFKL